MSRPPRVADSAVFVVRIWREYSLTEPRWYGRVEHLPSGRYLSFQDIEKMVDFICSSGVIEDVNHKYSHKS